MNREIFRLYHRPSFFEGIARLFDFNGELNKYNMSQTEDDADYRAIKSDWQHVGLDLLRAISEYEKESTSGEHGRQQRNTK
jgi:hypothetical protein